MMREEDMSGYKRGLEMKARNGALFAADALRLEGDTALWIQTADGSDPANLACLLGEIGPGSTLKEWAKEALQVKQVCCLAVVFLETATLDELRRIRARLITRVAFRIYLSNSKAFRVLMEEEGV